MAFRFTIKNKSIQPKINAVIATVVALSLVFLSIGIWGQWYITAPSHTYEQRRAYEENVRFWLGDYGIVFSFLLFLLIVIMLIAIVVFIKHAPYWKREIHTYGAQIKSSVDEVIGKLSTVADSADKMMKELPDTLKESLVESATVVAKSIKKN
jgi:ABC-type Fe3+ transport system permease subunit